ncbi:MAG: type III PLP-dependent enzyme [Limimaricola sp.]|uniref:type III PLP-dependent enzyme n=1 Tax=Limimaricola sp. TaxID=2211665 RepID=UPI001D2AC213|nr:type III PLP-dependent enzyme [Limimaricola sp.]MBI1415949.1 type III PLP-dependent enzyme [Limimaricola sp.]
MLDHTRMAADPLDWMSRHGVDAPVHFRAEAVLVAQAKAFVRGFGGMVTYAVKANPDEAVLRALAAGGVTGFDVASPEEIALVRRLFPRAALHYNNPVRSPAEIAAGLAAGVASWSVDEAGELEKLARLAPGTEVAVRFKLPVAGAAYNFGEKFGATPDEAIGLLARVAARGLTPALTFHVGTQCTDPSAWASYVTEAARIAAVAGVTIARLNVGGGFPSARGGVAIDLKPYFTAIHAALSAFPICPALVCEPGRALVADAFAHAVPVKALRPGRAYLADGIYGALSEAPSMGVPRFSVHAPGGAARQGAARPTAVFGPTCDSLDRLPGLVPLPVDTAPGDVMLFRGMGAYVTGVSTRFNGYGDWRTVSVASL